MSDVQLAGVILWIWAAFLFGVLVGHWMTEAISESSISESSIQDNHPTEPNPKNGEPQ